MAVDADTVHERFKDRIQAKLQKWGEGEVFNQTDEEYAYGVMAFEGIASIDFYIIEEAVRDGLEDGCIEGGYSFFMSITGRGGEIFGGIAPYNYTSKLWTRSIAELEDRWAKYYASVTRQDIDRCILEGMRNVYGARDSQEK